ncbi:MAG: DUF2953 domain-containing protein [Oscillospiraceae bacterium]|nr:DUF2953 domain-containing protein [Oscillospiraceae bacterium]
MIAFIIIVSILIFLFVLSLFNINVNLLYKDKPELTVKVLFFKFVFKSENYKKKKKPKKQPNVKKKKKKKKPEKQSQNTAKQKKKNPISDLMKKQGLSGLIDILKDLLSLVSGVLKGFLKYYIIHDLNVEIVIGGDDASDTAIQYGTACAVIYPILGQIYTRLNVNDYSADIRCNFEENSKTQVTAQLHSSIRILFVLGIVFKALFKAGKTYLKMKFRK